MNIYLTAVVLVYYKIYRTPFIDFKPAVLITSIIKIVILILKYLFRKGNNFLI